METIYQLQGIISGIIYGTPWWVWLILAWLIKLAFKYSQDHEVQLSRMAITTLIFGAWSLSSFWTLMIDIARSHSAYALPYFLTGWGLYLALIIVGSVAGFVIYRNTQHYFRPNAITSSSPYPQPFPYPSNRNRPPASHHDVWANGSLIPVAVIMVNFLIKYSLQVAMHYDIALTHSLSFAAIYVVTSGPILGVLIGGFFGTWRGVAGAVFARPTYQQPFPPAPVS